MLRKLGKFLFLSGVLLLIVFFAAPKKDAFYFRFFFVGIVLLAIGIVLYRLAKKEKSDSNRFRLLRKLFGKDEE